MTKLIQRGASTRSKDEGNRTPLHYAVRKGHIAVAEKLLEFGACPTQSDQLGATPLGVALSNKNDELAGLMLKEIGDHE